jgi:fucose 4-O-acetylase-like acetyltransferase
MVRNKVLDFAKGCLILLVLLGHTIQYYLYHGSYDFYYDYIFKIIYIFHMPLFMAISGYIAAYKLEQKPLSHIAREKFYQFVLPILVWCALWSLYSVIMIDPEALSLWAIAKLYVRTIISSYWFLWALTFSYITVRIICAIPGNSSIYILLSGIALLFVPADLTVWTMTKYTYIFFCFGYVINKSNIYVDLDKIKMALLLVSSIVVFVLWTPDTYIYVNKLSFSGSFADLQILLMLFGGAVYSIMALRIFAFLDRVTAPARIGRYIRNDIGSRTLQIYLAQELLFRIIDTSSFEPIESYLLGMSFSVLFSGSVAVLISVLVEKCAHVSPVATFFWGLGKKA